jgi:hypothetical protein
MNSIPLNTLFFIKALSIEFMSNSIFSYFSIWYWLYINRPFLRFRSQILRKISNAGLFFLVLPAKQLLSNFRLHSTEFCYNWLLCLTLFLFQKILRRKLV